MKINNKKFAFNLVEIMIAITIIGVLSAMLLPAMWEGTPNEDVVKFKKAHDNLFKTMNTLLGTGEYFLDGNFGIKPDGTSIDGTHTGDDTYFCEAISKTLNTKQTNCVSVGLDKSITYDNNLSADDSRVKKERLDNFCSQASGAKQYVKTIDGVEYFYLSDSSNNAFAKHDDLSNKDANGFANYYNVLCIKVSEDTQPFGYGIRYDGKIVTGSRADAWLLKSIKDKEQS